MGKALAPTVPQPPAGLTPGVEKAWDVYWRSPVASASEDIDMPGIIRLFDMYSQYEKASEIVKRSLVVKGSMGQIRVNPLADHMLQLETAIVRLEIQLGLTPLSRARLAAAWAPLR